MRSDDETRRAAWTTLLHDLADDFDAYFAPADLVPAAAAGTLREIASALAQAEAEREIAEDTLRRAGWELIERNAFGERIWKPPVKRDAYAPRYFTASRWAGWWKREAKRLRRVADAWRAEHALMAEERDVAEAERDAARAALAALYEDAQWAWDIIDGNAMGERTPEFVASLDRARTTLAASPPGAAPTTEGTDRD